MIPKISNYGNYESSNCGAHTLLVDLGKIKFYYSYKTIVAFASIETGLICCENTWGPTTGKHLNWIQPDKKKRYKSEEFETLLQDAIQLHIQ